MTTPNNYFYYFSKQWLDFTGKNEKEQQNHGWLDCIYAQEVDGVLAKIESSEQWYVIAKTRTSDLASLERSKNAAERDVYGLSELTVMNEPPVLAVSKPVKNKPDPVVNMTFELVVVGNPSYVVTADDVRYLVGAKFPSGHQLKSVHRDKIVVEKNGEVYEWVN